MDYILDNLTAIMAGAAGAFLFGGLYYRVLRSPWLDAAGANSSAAERRPGVTHYVGIFITEFWMACILAGAIILAPPEAGLWTMALGSAVIIWVGFVLPAIFVSYRVLGQSTRLIIFDTLHWLGAMLIMAALIRAVGVTQPG